MGVVRLGRYQRGAFHAVELGDVFFRERRAVTLVEWFCAPFLSFYYALRALTSRDAVRSACFFERVGDVTLVLNSFGARRFLAPVFR